MRARPSLFFSSNYLPRQLAITPGGSVGPGLRSLVYTNSSGEQFVTVYPKIGSFSDLRRVLKMESQNPMGKAMLTVHYQHLIPSTKQAGRQLNKLVDFARLAATFEGSDMAGLFEAANQIAAARASLSMSRVKPRQ